MKSQREFRPDDIVRLLSGQSPQRVLRVLKRHGQPYLVCRYLSEDHWGNIYGEQGPRAACDYTFYTPAGAAESTEEECTTMSKLYQTKTEPPEFGSVLATNSAGDLVLEMKGSNSVRVFKKEELELVVPYTVKLRSLSGHETRGSTRDVQVPKDSVVVGDLLLIDGSLAVVCTLNTKAQGAKPASFTRFRGEIVKSEGSVESGDEE